MSKSSHGHSGSQPRPCLQFGSAPTLTTATPALLWSWAITNPDRWLVEESAAASPFLSIASQTALGFARTITPAAGSGYYRITGIDYYGDACTDPSAIVQLSVA
jgi:hypothetical protein